MPIDENDDHHGVPFSFTGSNESLNLSEIQKGIHNYFHRMAGHSPPCFVGRKILIASTDWRSISGYGIPVEYYRDALGALMKDNWKHLYRTEAIRPETSEERENFARGAIHLYMHLAQEKDFTEDARNARGGIVNVSSHRQKFLKNALSFFETKKPTEAIKRLMNQTNEKGEYRWTKPFAKGARRRINEFAPYTKLQTIRRDDKEELRELLAEHSRKISEVMRIWEPNITTYANVIQELKNQPFFEAFLRNQEQLPSSPLLYESIPGAVAVTSSN